MCPICTCLHKLRLSSTKWVFIFHSTYLPKGEDEITSSYIVDPGNCFSNPNVKPKTGSIEVKLGKTNAVRFIPQPGWHHS